jgi:tetratricopeptide (TPR) repeat protein
LGENLQMKNAVSPRVRKSPLYLGLATALLFLFPGWSGAQTPEELLQQADAALQKQDYAAAAQALETYLARNPQDYRAKFNLAYAYSLTARRSEAIRQYEEVLAQEKELLPAHLNLGILLLEEGRAADALEHLQRVADQQPEHFSAQVNRAAALAALNRVPEARQAYERALQLKPDDAATHSALGKLLAPADAAAAEEHLRRAIALDPSVEDARLALAEVLEARAAQGADSLAEAAAIYREYLAAHPERGDLRLHLAGIYISQKRFADAIPELEAARALERPSFELNYTLLQAYVESKSHDKALALLPELLAQNEQDEELHLILGSLRMEKRQYREAAAAFRRATELEPNLTPGYTNLASALFLLKDYPGTVAALERVAALGQDTAGTYFLRALALDQLGLKPGALENYQRFLAAEGEKPADQDFQARQRIRVLSREVRR